MMLLHCAATGAYALARAACGAEDNARDAVVEQFAQQLAALHIVIADGEEEAVGNGFVLVTVVDNTEAVGEHNLLDAGGTASVFTDIIDETVGTLGGSVHHCSHCTLGAVADAR